MSARIILASLLVFSAPAWAADDAAMRMVGSIAHHPRVADDALPAFLIADDISSAGDGKLLLQGAAQVRRLDAIAKGERIEYDQETGQTDIRGNGLLLRGGNILRGPQLRFNTKTDYGEVEQPQFWLAGSAGAGEARYAEILGREHLRLEDMRYSGFDGPEPAWYIESSLVDLYLDQNEGVARNGTLYFKNVPILYSPWLTFPISDERKSGFLMPTYGTSSNGGVEITLPYYLNLAPNLDATLYPRYLSKRGMLLGAELRHLGKRSSSELFGTYIMRDRRTAQSRWLYSLQHSQGIAPGLSAWLDLRRVSDDDYFRDFSSFGQTDAAITYMPSQAALNWQPNAYVNGQLQFYRYQTLQDSTGSFLAPPYDMLPRLSLDLRRYDWHGLDIESANSITRFVAPIYTGSAFAQHSGRRIMPNGTRTVSYTSVARPYVFPGAYITPKVGLHLSRYDTEWFTGSPGMEQFAGRARSQTRVLPIASLDSGLIFERNTSLFGNPALQTLEPRLYYLYVPYRNQAELPVFDTGLATFNFQQAFDENIFSGGWDRIANANQLTAGVSTRWLDADTGFERVSLSFAQRFYFTNQQVTLADEAPRRDAQSDYLVGANAALTDNFSVYFDGMFDYRTQQRSRMSSGVRWSPKRLSSVALSYRYERDPNVYTDPYGFLPPDAVEGRREQVSLSTQWPLSPRWYGVGRYDYSIPEKRSTQSILGLEYRGDGGWATRVVLQRYAVSAQDVNTSLFLQLELTGLGSLGSNPMALLRERVTGYEPVSTLPPEKTVFERYE